MIKRIACIAMSFPAPSETFHSNNISALTQHCELIDVYSLLPKHTMDNKLIKERNLSKVNIHHCTLFNYISGLFIGIFTSPILFFKLFRFILKWNRKTHLLKSLFLIPRVFFISNEISKKQPDVVNLLWGHYPTLVGFVIKQKHPKIILSMGLLAYDLIMRFGGSQGIVPFVDILWTQAQFNIAAIKSLGFPSDKIKLIYDGLNLKTSIGNAEKIAFRIITIGRLLKPKGIDLCIRAFSLLAKILPESTLVILGDGPERTNLEMLSEQLKLSDRIFFKGHVSMTQVAEELAASEIFLFMSYSERLPNVVKEAMANRALCVCSQTPGIEELIEDKKTGFILNNNTPEKAAAIIEEIFQAKDDIELIKENAFRFITTNFDCNKEMQKLFNEWNSIKKTNAEI
ncbi:MAG: glycosyltransferase [Crenarchaeota archaeon]|nr:glycosyltransferase [Thermoproteota archaeon]